MERTLKAVLLAGLLSGSIAFIRGLWGWPPISGKLSMAMMVFFIIALLAIPPLLSGASE